MPIASRMLLLTGLAAALLGGSPRAEAQSRPDDLPRESAKGRWLVGTYENAFYVAKSSTERRRFFAVRLPKPEGKDIDPATLQGWADDGARAVVRRDESLAPRGVVGRVFFEFGDTLIVGVAAAGEGDVKPVATEWIALATIATDYKPGGPKRLQWVSHWKSGDEFTPVAADGGSMPQRIDGSFTLRLGLTAESDALFAFEADYADRTRLVGEYSEALVPFDGEPLQSALVAGPIGDPKALAKFANEVLGARGTTLANPGQLHRVRLEPLDGLLLAVRDPASGRSYGWKVDRSTIPIGLTALDKNTPTVVLDEGGWGSTVIGARVLKFRFEREASDLIAVTVLQPRSPSPGEVLP